MTHDYPIRGWKPSEVVGFRSSETQRHHTYYVYRLRDVLAERRTSSRPISYAGLRVTELVLLDQ